MNRHLSLRLSVCAATVFMLMACGMGGPMRTSPDPMSFFVTSVNPGQGAHLGGLIGADRHCQALATSVGMGSRTWRAYLSTDATGNIPAVHARDRIGNGPWYNAKGMMVARNIDELHGTNKISKQTALTEKGEIISGRGDPVNLHDILTGSSPEGRAMNAGKDSTCGNWTQGGDSGSAIVGHHDRMGPTSEAWAISWNSSHPTRGCSLNALKQTGGGGLLYCFAVR